MDAAGEGDVNVDAAVIATEEGGVNIDEGGIFFHADALGEGDFIMDAAGVGDFNIDEGKGDFNMDKGEGDFNMDTAGDGKEV